MCHITDNILEGAKVRYERGEKSYEVYARASQQRSTGMDISASFTECIASVLARWERDGYDGKL